MLPYQTLLVDPVQPELKAVYSGYCGTTLVNIYRFPF